MDNYKHYLASFVENKKKFLNYLGHFLKHFDVNNLSIVH